MIKQYICIHIITITSHIYVAVRVVKDTVGTQQDEEDGLSPLDALDLRHQEGMDWCRRSDSKGDASYSEVIGCLVGHEMDFIVDSENQSRLWRNGMTWSLKWVRVSKWPAVF